MKKFFGLFMMVAMVLFGSFGFAQETATEIVVSNDSFFKAIIDLVMGYKALGGAALTIAVVQLAIMFLKTEFFGKIFKNVKGSVKILILSGLTLLVGVLTLKQNGLSTAQAVMDSANLALLQVFAHQLYLQFVVKET